MSPSSGMKIREASIKKIIIHQRNKGDLIFKLEGWRGRGKMETANFLYGRPLTTVFTGQD